MRILYCEDDKELMEASLLLFQETFDASTMITSCHNSIQALELLKFNKYDLIISDCDMPEKMDGIKIYNRLTELNTPTPFIICTGRDKDDFRSFLLEPTFFYLSKPFTDNDLHNLFESIDILT